MEGTAGAARGIPPDLISAERIRTGMEVLLTSNGSVAARRDAAVLSAEVRQMPTAATVAKEPMVEYRG